MRIRSMVLGLLLSSAVATPAHAAGVQLIWDYVQGTSPADGFIIERCAGTACTNFVAIPGMPIPVTQLSYTDSNNLLPGTTYRWHVKAKGPGGVSAPSNAISFLVPQTPPASPANLRGTWVP